MPWDETLRTVQLCHMDDVEGFQAIREAFQNLHRDMTLSRIEVNGETTLQCEHGGTRIFWVYRGEGEVLLEAGTRTKEGDGQPLPEVYAAEPMPDGLLSCLGRLDVGVGTLHSLARPVVKSILSRRKDNTYVGEMANELWKLEHQPKPWSTDPAVNHTILALTLLCREAGYSRKEASSFEPLLGGDQLSTMGEQTLKVRGNFACLTMEHIDRRECPVSPVMRLRYLRDSSGGCNVEFDPFRRLPLTWYPALDFESGDGVNFVNSHVVNIPEESSPTHFHPTKAIGGGRPQQEMYLVLDPATYRLNTYGRRSHLITFPDLHDLTRFETHDLSPGTVVRIPPGVGHRGANAFVNVITVPGFKPHNEFYIDADIARAKGGSPYNADLVGLKNYGRLEELL